MLWCLPEPFALPPLVFVQEHSVEFGEPVRRILERPQDDRAFVDREREQLHLVGEGTVEPVGQLVEVVRESSRQARLRSPRSARRRTAR
jgi:hypothetical protein